jgi:hypothetical protein
MVNVIDHAAGFVSSERSMSIAFSNIATWNASDGHDRF